MLKSGESCRVFHARCRDSWSVRQGGMKRASSSASAPLRRHADQSEVVRRQHDGLDVDGEASLDHHRPEPLGARADGQVRSSRGWHIAAPVDCCKSTTRTQRGRSGAHEDQRIFAVEQIEPQHHGGAASLYAYHP